MISFPYHFEPSTRVSHPCNYSCARDAGFFITSDSPPYRYIYFCKECYEKYKQEESKREEERV